MRAAIVLNSQNIANIEEDYIIAADAGYKHVLAQGKTPNVIIGDFDSSEMPQGFNVIKLNIEKDDTDGQAAIAYAKENNIDDVVIYGVGGGRIDHQLCNLSLLCEAYKLGINARAKEADADIYYKETGKVSFKANIGATFSIIAFGNSVTITNGVNTKYPINNLTVYKFNLGRTISNQALAKDVSFEITDGAALIFVYKK